MIEDVAGNQEIFELETRESQQLTCLVVGKGAGPVTLNREGLKRLATGIGMPGDVFRKLDRNLH